MCDPVSAAVVIGGLGVGTKYFAQEDAASNRKKAVGRAQDWQDKASRKTLDTSMTNAQQYDPTARAQANTQAQDTATHSLQGYLEAAKQPSEAVKGAVSSVFSTGRAERTLADANRATTLARLFGKMRGATDLRSIEGLNNADAATRVAGMARNKANMAGAQSVDIQEAGTPDPTLMLLGSLMSGYGMAAAGGAAGAGAPAQIPQYIA